MTTWNEHETDKCGEGEIKNILMGESVVDVPTTFVSENIFGTKIMPQIKPTWFDVGMTGKHNSCRGMRWSLQESEWKSNSTHVDDMTKPTLVMKATGRQRDIDGIGTSSPAMGPSVQKETWLYRRQADPKTLHACQNTSRAAEDLTKETVLSTLGEHGRRACCDARPSRIRLTNRKSESHGTIRRLPEMASLWRERVAPPELMGGSSRTVLTLKQTSQILEQIGTGAEARATSGNSAMCKTSAGKQIESVQNLTTERSIHEARHKNETQLKSEDTILNRTPKRKRIRQSR